EQLSGEHVAAVYTAGGGSNSDTWLRIRANVLGRPIYKCRDANGAVGAAVVAASKTRFGSIAEAARSMTAIAREVVPEPAMVDRYETGYRNFVTEMKKKGYC